MSATAVRSLLDALRETLRSIESQTDPMTPEKARLLRYLRERIAMNDPDASPLNPPAQAR